MRAASAIQIRACIYACRRGIRRQALGSAGGHYPLCFSIPFRNLGQQLKGLATRPIFQTWAPRSIDEKNLHVVGGVHAQPFEHYEGLGNRLTGRAGAGQSWASPDESHQDEPVPPHFSPLHVERNLLDGDF